MNKQIYIAKSENKLDVDVNIAIDIDIYRERERSFQIICQVHIFVPQHSNIITWFPANNYIVGWFVYIHIYDKQTTY
jgi:hypothetical protein